MRIGAHYLRGSEIGPTTLSLLHPSSARRPAPAGGLPAFKLIVCAYLSNSIFLTAPVTSASIGLIAVVIYWYHPLELYLSACVSSDGCHAPSTALSQGGGCSRGGPDEGLILQRRKHGAFKNGDGAKGRMRSPASEDVHRRPLHTGFLRANNDTIAAIKTSKIVALMAVSINRLVNALEERTVSISTPPSGLLGPDTPLQTLELLNIDFASVDPR